MPLAFESIDALASALRMEGHAVPGTLLVVDGYNRRGKTTAARKLAEFFGATHIDADDYVVNGAAHFPEAVDRNRIRIDVQRALLSMPVIFSSVLALGVLRAAAQSHSCHVYVRHSWPPGTYTDGEVLYPQCSPEQLLADEDAVCRATGFADNAPVLGRELLNYHLNEKPHEYADYVLDVAFDLDVALPQARGPR